MTAKTEILGRYFGYTSFRPLQEETLGAVLAGRDVSAVLATGGKPLCYPLPALLLGGLAVVASPLISLMKDQVDALAATGIPAATINSTMTYAERVATGRAFTSGAVRILSVSPWAGGAAAVSRSPLPLRPPARHRRRGALHLCGGIPSGPSTADSARSRHRPHRDRPGRYREAARPSQSPPGSSGASTGKISTAAPSQRRTSSARCSRTLRSTVTRPGSSTASRRSRPRNSPKNCRQRAAGKSGAAPATAARRRRRASTAPGRRGRSSPASGGRFGASYIADVICGSKSGRIRENGHDIIPAYGSGTGYTRDQWLRFLQKLVRTGAVTPPAAGILFSS